jgi:hypothetical protein
MVCQIIDDIGGNGHGYDNWILADWRSAKATQSPAT